MPLQYDMRGNLTPATKIDLTWQVFLDEFVKRFPSSTSRQRLCANFADFIERLQQEIAKEFTVWVGGSFVSQKVNPADVDAVFFIDHQSSELKKSILDRVWFNGSLKYSKGLDVYYSIEYPPTHKRHFLTHLDYLHWEDLYGKTRQDAAGRRLRKGFIELKFK